MNLIVGLGNPGLSYAHNRHNIGFRCVNHLARTHGIRFDKKQCLARTGAGKIEGHEVVLARPQTYMNASGESVSRLLKKLKITSSELIVIHDDLDLPVGKIRLRLDGGSGGHKGVDSIAAEAGSRDFYRIRIGIGRPLTGEDPSGEKEEAIIDYVLSDFSPEENKTIKETIPRVDQALVCLLSNGLTAAMNRYN